MNSIEFNKTLDEFCLRLFEAFPDSCEIIRARELMLSMINIDNELPAKTFAQKMQPFALQIEQHDVSFMDGPDSPLHFLGIYESWTRMHDVTKMAVMDYVVRMAELAGVRHVVVSDPKDQLTGLLDPAVIANIFEIARKASSNMTDEDANALLEGRNSQKLGDLCFSIIDSLSSSGSMVSR